MATIDKKERAERQERIQANREKRRMKMEKRGYRKDPEPIDKSIADRAAQRVSRESASSSSLERTAAKRPDSQSRPSSSRAMQTRAASAKRTGSSQVSAKKTGITKGNGNAVPLGQTSADSRTRSGERSASGGLIRAPRRPKNADRKGLDINVKLIGSVAAILLVLILVVSGARAIDGRGQIKALNEMALTVNATVTPVEGQDSEITANNARANSYSELYGKNQNFIGWLSISGTKLNFPVMKNNDDPDFYKNHDFEKEKARYGVPYVNASCDVSKPSDNLTIYGNNKLFDTLYQYKSEDYYRQHPNLEFDSLKERGQYQIIGVFETKANKSGFAYKDFIDAADKAAYDAFIAKVKELSLYDTGATAEYGNKLVSISAVDGKDHFVVVAKKTSSTPINVTMGAAPADGNGTEADGGTAGGEENNSAAA